MGIIVYSPARLISTRFPAHGSAVSPASGSSAPIKNNSVRRSTCGNNRVFPRSAHFYALPGTRLFPQRLVALLPSNNSVRRSTRGNDPAFPRSAHFYALPARGMVISAISPAPGSSLPSNFLAFPRSARFHVPLPARCSVRFHVLPGTRHGCFPSAWVLSSHQIIP